jgi:hypothetical protein
MDPPQTEKPSQDAAHAAFLASLGLPSSILLEKDEHGRLRVAVPTSGHLFMRNRVTAFSNPTAFNHSEDLVEIIGKLRAAGKAINDLLLVSDSGADYDHSTIKVHVALANVFDACNLGVLGQVFHAPGESFRNWIERLFCLLNIVDGVTYKSKLSGEAQAPDAQTDLTPEQIRIKQLLLYGPIFDFLDETWGSLKTHGWTVDCERVIPELNREDIDEALNGLTSLLRNLTDPVATNKLTAKVTLSSATHYNPL